MIEWLRSVAHEHAPGLLGSIAAMLWIRDTWPRRIAYIAAGAIASHYGAPVIARWLDADPSLAGFLVGLFSMACCAKLFEAIEALSPKKLIDRILTKVGL